MDLVERRPGESGSGGLGFDIAINLLLVDLRQLDSNCFLCNVRGLDSASPHCSRCLFTQSSQERLLVSEKGQKQKTPLLIWHTVKCLALHLYALIFRAHPEVGHRILHLPNEESKVSLDEVLKPWLLLCVAKVIKTPSKCFLPFPTRASDLAPLSPGDMHPFWATFYSWKEKL